MLGRLCDRSGGASLRLRCGQSSAFGGAHVSAAVCAARQASQEASPLPVGARPRLQGALSSAELPLAALLVAPSSYEEPDRGWLDPDQGPKQSIAAWSDEGRHTCCAEAVCDLGSDPDWLVDPQRCSSLSACTPVLCTSMCTPHICSPRYFFSVPSCGPAIIPCHRD